MKSLRLVFDSPDGERKDIELSMEKWIATGGMSVMSYHRIIQPF